MREVRCLAWLVALALAGAVLGGCASDGGHYGPGRGGGPPRTPIGPSVDEIIRELDLTEHQTPEVRGVLEASQDEREEIMKKHGGARGPGAFEEVREKLEGLQARTETMLQPLLTDDQMARYRQIVERAEAERERAAEEMKARRPMGSGGGPGGRPGP